MTFRGWHFCGEKSKRKNMFIKVAQSPVVFILFLSTCWCSVVSGDLCCLQPSLWFTMSFDSDTGRGGGGWVMFNDCLTTIHLPAQSMTPFRQIFIQSKRASASCWHVSDAENLAWMAKSKHLYKQIMRKFGDHLGSTHSAEHLSAEHPSLMQNTRNYKTIINHNWMLNSCRSFLLL